MTFAQPCPPSPATTPYVAGPEGLTTPPVVWSVPIRLLVALLPMLFTQKLTVTCSLGSMTPLGGTQLSVTKVAGPTVSRGTVGWRQKLRPVFPPLVTTPDVLTGA